jgi:DNA-binding CsgD family transcriptional regulator
MLGQKHVKEKSKNHGLENLTDRELQIFHLLGAELSARKIAGELKLSIKTVETHRENIKHKLGFDSARKLAEHALKWLQRNGESTVSKELPG